MEHQLLKSIASKIMLFASLFIAFTGYSEAQNTDFDTKGKEFRFSFMPNLHSNNTDYADSIYIYISAEKPTKVYIELTTISGTKSNSTINITDINKMYLISRYYEDYEIKGDYNNNWDDPTIYSKNIQRQGVYIRSDEEINVYGLSASYTSSDAFLVFPNDVLGTRYYVMSYTSDYHSSYTPSQFVITAIEDNTSISINPTCRTSSNKDRLFSIDLNKGESYLVQAMKTSDLVKPDLTGTEINSNKPIAVFGGHQRSALPREMSSEASSPSRDILVDQIPSLQTWGKNAFLIPFPQPNGVTTEYNDKYRIISSADSNAIRIDDKEIILAKGKFYEGDLLNTPISIIASKPILVAQYKRTASLSSGFILDSDPLMMVIPPKEQFIQKAKLMNMPKEEKKNYYSKPEDVFTKQYIMIVAPDSAVAQCKIDNVFINRNNFNKIPNSDYSYYVLNTTSGVHDFESTAKCGLYVVGYGGANSYGYVGGMELKSINDTLPPEIFTSRECYRLNGTIRDDASDTEGLQKIEFVEELSYNVNVTLPDDYIGASVANFTIDLIDKNEDGFYAIKVVDIKKNETLFIDTIQGNTLVANYSDGIDNDFGIVPIGHEKCKYIQFENKGILPYYIPNSVLNSGYNFSIPQSQYPLQIAPGEKKNFLVCLNPEAYKNNVFVTDSVIIQLDCYSVIVPLTGQTEPLVKELESKCGLPFKMTLTTLVGNYLFEEIMVEQEVDNAKIIFGIPKQTHTKLVVFDVFGNEKQVLLEEETAAGLYEMNFSVQNYESGLYFISMICTDRVITRKLLINR